MQLGASPRFLHRNFRKLRVARRSNALGAGNSRVTAPLFINGVPRDDQQTKVAVLRENPLLNAVPSSPPQRKSRSVSINAKAALPKPWAVSPCSSSAGRPKKLTRRNFPQHRTGAAPAKSKTGTENGDSLATLFFCCKCK